MKKLMTILVLFAMCGVAMASAPIDLTVGANKEYGNPNGTYSGLKYTVTESISYGMSNDNDGTPYERNFGKAYFTTNTVSPNGGSFNAGEKITVQFLGAEPELGNEGSFGYDSKFKVQDYGIYLYNPDTKTVGTFFSAKEENSFKLDPGQSFGVYFTDKDGDMIGTTGLSNNHGVIRGAVANWDDDPKHDITIGNENASTTYSTLRHYMCLFEGNTKHKEYLGWGFYNTYYTDGYTSLGNATFEQSHFEFMLQTTMDEDYIPVNGQPLPGTLATLLIGGLCAGSLRKRNKKH
jgi:hypothetical protein